MAGFDFDFEGFDEVIDKIDDAQGNVELYELFVAIMFSQRLAALTASPAPAQILLGVAEDKLFDIIEERAFSILLQRSELLFSQSHP